MEGMKKKNLLKIIRPLGILILASLSFFSQDLSELTGSRLIGEIFRQLTVFESKFYDYRNEKNIHAEREADPDIFLIKIDDYSLEKLGVWPLPRTVYADLLTQLSKYDVKVVAFDILFPEKSPAYAGVNPDVALRKAFTDFSKENRTVVLSFSVVPLEIKDDEIFSKTGEAILESFPEELYLNTVNSKENEDGYLARSGISKETYPIREFVAAGTNLGFISTEEDADGVFRKYRLIAKPPTDEGSLFDSLGLISYLEWSKEKNIFAEFYKSLAGYRPGISFQDGSFYELDREGMGRIRYIGAENAFKSFSLYDVLHPTAEIDQELRALKGKIVFLGSTANGAHDLRQTPVSPKMPGVYAHMNMFYMLKAKHFFKKAEDSIMFSAIFLIFGMALFLFLHQYENAVLDLLALLLLTFGSYFIDVNFFLPQGFELKLAACYFCFIVTYLWNTFLNFYEASKEKRQIRGTFARYVAPTVVDEMLKDPDNIQVGGKRMDITCLFSDVRDFTSISEGLSAQDLANMLNTYMNRMTDIVFETKGTLDKYIGDAIVAIWGAPLPIGNHAQFAVDAAIRMAETMPAVNEYFKEKGLPQFNVGIGLNTGECSVGNMGSTRIFSYTALGDNMNLGARLEGLCKYYGAQILISENTLARIDTKKIKTRPIDKVIVKGRTQAVEIFEVISKVHFMFADEETHQFYLTGWQFYTHRNFRGAVEVFEQILSKYPDDKNTKRLKGICEKYLVEPSLATEDFDITKMTEK